MNPLVKKVRASGTTHAQKLKVKKLKVHRPQDHSTNRVTTKKGDNKALVAMDGKPVSYEPIDAPKSLSLARISKNLRIPK